MPQKPICSICHRPLTDARSVAIGIGPECRGSSSPGKKLTKKQRSQLARVGRTEAFFNGKDIVFPEITYKKDVDGWTLDGDRYWTDDQVEEWLTQYDLIDVNVLTALRVV